MVVCPTASALNPSLDVSQYAHTTWPIRDGFFKSEINSIAQTSDGYLWLGTELGLVRFDGVRPVSWIPPGQEQLPSAFIVRLFVGRDGTLWIGTVKGLASWNGAKVTRYPELDGLTVVSFSEEPDGTVWAGLQGNPTGRLCRIRSGKTQCYGQDGLVGKGVLSLFQDSSGSLWAGAVTGLWRWQPGSPIRFSMPNPEIRDLNLAEDGQLLISMPPGISQLVDGKAKLYRIAGAPNPLSPNKLLRDRDRGLWIGTTDHGILHVHQGRTDVFSRSDGLSSNRTLGLFEDREGNIWVSTTAGLDRFREFTVSTVSIKQGLSSDDVWSVQAARDRTVWLGTRNGLNRLTNGNIHIFRKANGLPDDAPTSLFEDKRERIWLQTRRGLAYFDDGRFVLINAAPNGQVHAIAEDTGDNLWLSEDQNLLRVAGRRVIEQIPWASLGAQENAWALLAGREQGGLWLGFRNRGVIYLNNGQIRESYTTTNGLGAGSVGGLYLDREGAVWASTEGGLSRIENGRIATLTSRNGLPCDFVHWLIEDDDHSFWLYTACGLVRIARPELSTWIENPTRRIQIRVFDESDGVSLRSNSSGYSPRVAKSTDGRLWFVAADGVQVLDPRHLSTNKLPPPVHIEQIIADHRAISNIRLPALTRDLEIDYTALSLVAPEKNRFKYKLEGHDRDWQDAGNRRQAFYNDLPPRSYRFRVIASNNSGVWNEAGDTLDFSIAPAYYQTTWFRVSLAGAFFLALWGLYRYRLYQVTREFSVRLDERVGERTRIARDLHDTLLQSFQGLLYEFQAARNLFLRRPEEAMSTLDGAIGSARAAIAEGRDAIQNLRVRASAQSNLASLLTMAGEELAGAQQSNGHGAAFGLTVEGLPQPLSPGLQDEIYRITREILSNAFHHAKAKKIEVEIRYDNKLLRLRVRDDGIGIDPNILTEGAKRGHWGLPGVRERAKLVGAKLDFWSEVGAGTEIQLTVRGSIAYANAREGRTFNLFRKGSRLHGD